MSVRRLLHRLFGAAAPAAPAPGSSALAKVYERAGRWFVEPSDRTRWSEAGYWVASGRVTVLDSTSTDDALGAAVLEALSASRVEVPVPPRGTKLEAGLFRAMKVRSRRAAMSGTRSCMVTLEPPAGMLRIEPVLDGGVAGERSGYSGTSGGVVELAPATAATEVGQAVRAALARAVVGT